MFKELLVAVPLFSCLLLLEAPFAQRGGQGDAGVGMDMGFLLLNGSVVLEDGTPAPESVRVDFVCQGQIMKQDYVDSMGRFEFELGGSSSGH